MPIDFPKLIINVTNGTATPIAKNDSFKKCEQKQWCSKLPKNFFGVGIEIYIFNHNVILFNVIYILF